MYDRHNYGWPASEINEQYHLANSEWYNATMLASKHRNLGRKQDGFSKDDALMRHNMDKARYWNYFMEGLRFVMREEVPNSDVYERWMLEGPTGKNYWAAAGFRDGYYFGFTQDGDEPNWLVVLHGSEWDLRPLN